MPARVKYHRSALRQLEAIAKGDKASARAIAEAIDALADEPHPHGSETLDEPLYRIRVRDYRVIYGFDAKDKLTVILKIARRSEATYRGLEKLSERFKKIYKKGT